MPGGGDGAACQATSPDEERWVLHPVTLARQRTQETARHASALPLVAGTEAPPPEPNTAQFQGRGMEGTTTVESLGGVGGAASKEDAGGACILPLTWSSAPCAPSPWFGSQRMEGGADGGATVPHCLDQVPRGVNNLGEALAAICSLASFPPLPGALAYRPWALGGYVLESSKVVSLRAP
jgi:hypothetical protein